MASKILILFLTTFLLLKHVFADSMEDISYVEGINMEYKNGTWLCGDVECPDKGTGCHILIRTFADDRKVLYQSFNCIDSHGAGDRIELSTEKIIDIDLKSYDDAQSAYSVGYGLGGDETAKGVVALGDLQKLKESFREQKKAIIDSNTKSN